jgi:hypothetical protein
VTLQAASVIGRVFTAAALGRLLHPQRPQLGELVDRDFVRRQRAAQPLTRQVAYDLLPVGRRARLHAADTRVLSRPCPLRLGWDNRECRIRDRELPNVSGLDAP